MANRTLETSPYIRCHTCSSTPTATDTISGCCSLASIALCSAT